MASRARRPGLCEIASVADPTSPPPGKIFGALIEEVRFAADSFLEGDGFEPSVPRPDSEPSDADAP